MDLTRSTAVLAAVLLSTALAVPALTAGVAGAQGARQVDSCTTITESGAYELNGSIGVADESVANGTAENATGDDAPAGDATNESAALANATTVDAVGACVVVTADDVVFDGNGFVLAGGNVTALHVSANASAAAPDATNAGAAGPVAVAGIAVRPAAGDDAVSNVTIRDVTVRDWYVGLSLRNASGVTLENVTFADNAVPGFRVDNATGLRIRTGDETATPAA